MRRFISYQDYMARHRRAAPAERGDDAEEEYEVPVGNASACGLGTAIPDVPVCQSDCASDYGAAAQEIDSDPSGEYLIGKKKTARRRGGWGSVLILFLCFGIAVSCAVLMSDGLDLKHLLGGNKLEFAEHKVYCVQTAAPSTPEEASEVAKDTRKKGGGGYVYVSDGLYLVLASAYENESDCDSVIEKLSLSKTTASKYCITIEKTVVNSIKDNALKTKLVEAYEQIWESYRSLYAMTLDLDTGNTTASGARVQIGHATDRVKERLATLSEDASPATLRVRSALTSVATQLETLNADLNRDDTLSVDLKYAYLKILHVYDNLSKDLEKIR